MSDLAWAVLELIAETAAVASVCNLVTRNSIVSTGVAVVVTLLLLYWFSARHDALWPIAAIVVVPVVVLTAIGVAIFAYGIRMATGHLDKEA